MDQDLTRKVVIVTGAGSGLGEATAQAFGCAGCQVVCLDLNDKNLQRVTDDLRAKDVACTAFACDVSHARQVFDVIEQVVAQYGRIDILVNNAAVDHTLSVTEMSVEQWDQVIGVNLRGPFLLAKAVLPHMQRQNGGHIVNIASTAATRAWANASAYLASKWGLVGFSRGLGVEGRPYNIRVTTIIPGGMRTHFFDRFADQGIPMPDEANLQDPAIVANVIVSAVRLPQQSVIQEVLVTPLTESSWP
ncbi:MAG: SDR family oxidoreductase [Anaerolineaceae bacterium]|nr:SDR family oxidoreductase [Anaerolineaceae bacterium]